MNRAYSRLGRILARATWRKRRRASAEHSELKKDLEKNKSGPMAEIYDIQAQELRGRLALARGETLDGLKFLSDAAQKEFELQRGYADPPVYPEALYNSARRGVSADQEPAASRKAFEKALTLTHNDLFALSGLVRAYAAAGEKAKAEDAMATPDVRVGGCRQGACAIAARHGRRRDRDSARFVPRSAAQLPRARRWSNTARIGGSLTPHRNSDVKDSNVPLAVNSIRDARALA